MESRPEAGSTMRVFLMYQRVFIVAESGIHHPWLDRKGRNGSFTPFAERDYR